MEKNNPYKIIYTTTPAPTDVFAASNESKISDVRKAPQVCEKRCNYEGGKYSGLWFDKTDSSVCNCNRIPVETIHPAYTQQPTFITTRAPGEPIFSNTTSLPYSPYQTLPPTTPHVSYGTHYPTNQTTHYPTNQTTHYPVNQTTHYPVNQTTHYPVNQTTHYPTNQTTHYPKNNDTTHPSTIRSGTTMRPNPVTNVEEIPELPLLPIPDKKHINLSKLELPAEFPLYENIKTGKFKYSFADNKYNKLLHGFCDSAGGKFNGTYSVSHGKVYIHCQPKDQGSETHRPRGPNETHRPSTKEQMVLIPPQVPGYGTMKSMKNRYQPIFDKVCSLANKVSDGSYTIKNGDLYANCVNKM